MSSRRFAFILRVWNEAPAHGQEGPPEVRGSLRLANSEEVVYFRSVDELPHILRRMTGWDASQRPPDEGAT